VKAAPSRLDSLRSRLVTPKANDVMVISHRACWRQGPENSLAGIAACIDMGVDMVEIDVHITSDGQLVIMHDDSVDRTTNGTGLISSLTLAQIKALSLKEGEGGPAAALTSYKVPTVEEALDVARGKVLVNLHAKGNTLLPTLALVRKLGFTDQVLFKGSDLPKQDLAQFKGVYFMPVINERNSKTAAPASYDWIKPVAFEIVYSDPRYLQKINKDLAGKGYRHWVNIMWVGLAGTLTDDAALKDPDANWGYLVSQGVNMIQTDRPQALLAYLKAKNLR
jgi:glycerophosphoryl diester phosphodiesterase